MFTDNQVLKHFLAKPTFNRREARRIELFAQFGMNQINLKSGRVHKLVDVPSLALHVMEAVTLHKVNLCDAERPFNFETQHEHAQLFGQIVKVLREVFEEDKVQRDRKFRLLPLFKYAGNKLFFADKTCARRCQVMEVLQAAHDA